MMKECSFSAEKGIGRAAGCRQMIKECSFSAKKGKGQAAGCGQMMKECSFSAKKRQMTGCRVKTNDEGM